MNLLCSLLITIFISIQPLELDLKVKRKPTKTNLIFLDESKDYRLNFSPYTILFTLNVCVGYPQQCFDSMVDTGSEIFWVPENTMPIARRNYYTPQNSSYAKVSNETYTIEYMKGKTTGVFVEDVVTLDNKINPEHLFKFLSASNDTDPIEESDGILGMFKLTEANQDYSFLNHLKKQGIIDKYIFSMRYTDVTEGKMYVGEYHDDFKYEHAKCDSNGFNFWACDMKYMKAGDSYYKIDPPQTLVFDSGTNCLIGNKTILEGILAKAMKEFKHGSSCRILTAEGFGAQYECDYGIDIESFPKVEFIFGNYGLKIVPSLLFGCSSEENKCVLNIIMSDTSDEWILGQNLLLNYHVLYDGENNTMGFQGDYRVYNNTEFEGNDPIIKDNKSTSLTVGVITNILDLIDTGIGIW
jgi:hypothetical protein